eukprot:TRINITY_DN10274_c0_g1_i1.p1 TRINITY_DN10274_c0_g1~~TRINITY_DN10274_c0_g1_i1.p1  ORF type:complete len:751 (+),score=133.24 TRINITY_DN10274_c0_g1_i1:69-2321(+)
MPHKYTGLEVIITKNPEIMRSVLETINEDEDSIIWKVLTQIFANHKSSSILVSHCIDQEVKNTTKESLLLRGGGCYIRVLSEYARSQGVNYLREVLGDCIRKIARGPPLEVDPARLKTESIGDLSKNREYLNKTCQKCLNTIFKSVDHLPRQIRQMCKELWQGVKSKFPSSQNFVIGAFFFLRFICPALVYPEEYAIMTECTSEMRRKLTLVTKLIQNISNQTDPEEKEAYMSSFTNLIQSNLSKLDDFYNNLLDIQLINPYLDIKTFKCSPYSVYDFLKSRLNIIQEKLDINNYNTLKEKIDEISREIEIERTGIRLPFFRRRPTSIMNIENQETEKLGTSYTKTTLPEKEVEWNCEEVGPGPLSRRRSVDEALSDRHHHQDQLLDRAKTTTHTSPNPNNGRLRIQVVSSPEILEGPDRRRSTHLGNLLNLIKKFSPNTSPNMPKTNNNSSSNNSQQNIPRIGGGGGGGGKKSNLEANAQLASRQRAPYSSRSTASSSSPALLNSVRNEICENDQDANLQNVFDEKKLSASTKKERTRNREKTQRESGTKKGTHHRVKSRDRERHKRSKENSGKRTTSEKSSTEQLTDSLTDPDPLNDPQGLAATFLSSPSVLSDSQVVHEQLIEDDEEDDFQTIYRHEPIIPPSSEIEFEEEEEDYEMSMILRHHRHRELYPINEGGSPIILDESLVRLPLTPPSDPPSYENERLLSFSYLPQDPFFFSECVPRKNLRSRNLRCKSMPPVMSLLELES